MGKCLIGENALLNKQLIFSKNAWWELPCYGAKGAGSCTSQTHVKNVK